jgi:hypothetical protein
MSVAEAIFHAVFGRRGPRRQRNNERASNRPQARVQEPSPPREPPRPAQQPARQQAPPVAAEPPVPASAVADAPAPTQEPSPVQPGSLAPPAAAPQAQPAPSSEAQTQQPPTVTETQTEKPPGEDAPKPAVLDHSFIEKLRCRESKPLGRADYEAAAAALGLTEWEVIGAVARTEAERGAYGPDGRPTILFERHKFHEFTKGVHSAQHPDISNARGGGYGDGSHENAWRRFERAYALDPEAAIKATSWGQFQMMGFNFFMTPHTSPQAMVAFMAENEVNQLSVFMDFVRHCNLIDAMRTRSWREFAAAYNGSGYERNRYHEKMERFYNEFRNGADAAAPAPKPPVGYVVPTRWRLAKSLEKLRAQLDLKYPDRGKDSDGDLGDARHAALGDRSDHNAYIMDGDMPVVTAMDVTHDVQKCSGRTVVDALIASKDPRIKYIIFDKKICSSRNTPWTWREYKGDNPHQHHFHISVDADKAKYDDDRDWQV